MFKAFKFRSMAKDAPFVPWTRPYDGIACAEDIFFCFRLLLGRHPAAGGMDRTCKSYW